MHTLKFRAWGIATKQMLSVDKIFWNLEGAKLAIISTISEIEDRALAPGEFDLMQFTGLHDKNGKEIYEGDIIKNRFGDINAIQWKESSARFVFNKDQRGARIINSLDAEIIGNIYENPELLTN